MMHERLRYLNETLNTALDNYTEPSFSNRTKRSLINGLGQLSNMLFGTAMDGDVQDHREKYNPLTLLAANQNKVINMNSLHLTDLSMRYKTLLPIPEPCGLPSAW